MLECFDPHRFAEESLIQQNYWVQSSEVLELHSVLAQLMQMDYVQLNVHELVVIEKMMQTNNAANEMLDELHEFSAKSSFAEGIKLILSRLRSYYVSKLLKSCFLQPFQCDQAPSLPMFLRYSKRLVFIVSFMATLRSQRLFDEIYDHEAAYQIKEDADELENLDLSAAHPLVEYSTILRIFERSFTNVQGRLLFGLRSNTKQKFSSSSAVKAELVHQFTQSATTHRITTRQQLTHHMLSNTLAVSTPGLTQLKLNETALNCLGFSSEELVKFEEVAELTAFTAHAELHLAAEMKELRNKFASLGQYDENDIQNLNYYKKINSNTDENENNVNEKEKQLIRRRKITWEAHQAVARVKRTAEAVMATHSVDEAHEILFETAQHRTKMVQILNLAWFVVGCQESEARTVLQELRNAESDAAGMVVGW